MGSLHQATHKMAAVVLEVLIALVFTVYHVIERVVKIFLPQKMFEKNISGQVVLITGGGSGIGRLMCLRFARLGATVVTWDINKSGNEETVDMIKKEGNRAFSYTVDMSSREAIYNAAEKTKEDIGPVTILVNNAGIVSGTPVMDTPDSKIIKTFEVNILAHFWMIKAFLPDMINHKLGHIVVGAVLTNREVLLLPWWSYMLIALKAIVPEPAFMRLSQAFGFNCSMDQFTGRTKKE